MTLLRNACYSSRAPLRSATPRHRVFVPKKSLHRLRKPMGPRHAAQYPRSRHSRKLPHVPVACITAYLHGSLTRSAGVFSTDGACDALSWVVCIRRERRSRWSQCWMFASELTALAALGTALRLDGIDEGRRCSMRKARCTTGANQHYV